MTIGLSREDSGGAKPPEREEKTDDGGLPERTDVRWSGRLRAERVPDDAEEFEEQHTGIRITYLPEEEEVRDCLKKALRAKGADARLSAPLSALTVFTVAFAAAGARSGSAAFFLAAAACAAGLALVASLPGRRARRMAREYAAGGEVRVRVYPDRVQIARNGETSEIPLDGGAERARTEDALALFVRGEKGPRLVLPLRRVDPGALPEVQAMILAGTRPLGPAGR